MHDSSADDEKGTAREQPDDDRRCSKCGRLIYSVIVTEPGIEENSPCGCKVAVDVDVEAGRGAA